MLGYLKRLVTTGAAYQFGDILAKGLALRLRPPAPQLWPDR